MTERTLQEFGGLSPAEEAMIAALDSGFFDRLGPGVPPDEDNGARDVRASLIRFLMIGGADAPRLHEKGLRLSGARIRGVLDLEGCRIRRDIGLADCRFDAAPILRSAVIDTLFLDGSVAPGLVADRLEARGGVYLRGARIDGAILLRGARVGGEVVIDGAALDRSGGVAVVAADIEVGGDFSLRGATCLGGVTLTAARIGGDLGATGAAIGAPDGTALLADGVALGGDVAMATARIEGECRFVGARIGGDVTLDGGTFAAPGTRALTFNRAEVSGALFLREDARITGVLGLTGARIGAISDAPSSWPAPGDLLLDRCIYGGFLGAPVDATLRLDWLSRQQPERWREEFWPQPYEHLSAVLAEMGHGEDAQTVLMVKERLQRRARRARTTFRPGRAGLFVRDAVLRATVGYGLKPLRAMIWLAALWALGAGLFTLVWEAEEMRPNVAFLLRAPEWVLCEAQQGQRIRMQSIDAVRVGLASPGQSQMACFLAQPEARSLPKFNPWMFSLDALIPGLETGQRGYWSPDTRGALGAAGKAYEYLQAMAGWALGLLAVAGFSGIVKSR